MSFQDKTYTALLEAYPHHSEENDLFWLLKESDPFITHSTVVKALCELKKQGLVKSESTKDGYHFWSALSPHEIVKNKCKNQ